MSISFFISKHHENSSGYFWKATKLFSLLQSYHLAKAKSDSLTKNKIQACQSSLKILKSQLQDPEGDIQIYLYILEFVHFSFSHFLGAAYAPVIRNRLSHKPVSTFEDGGPPV